jgi:hypothetical protein
MRGVYDLLGPATLSARSSFGQISEPLTTLI